MINSTERHPAFEEYCECIFELHEDVLEVIQARIAERLQVSRASVSQMIEKMSKLLIKKPASGNTSSVTMWKSQ